MPPAVMGRMALEFVFVRILIKLGYAILEHTVVLFAPSAVVRFNWAGVQPLRHQLDIDSFGLVYFARRLRIDRPQHVRRSFGHVSRAC